MPSSRTPRVKSAALIIALSTFGPLTIGIYRGDATELAMVSRDSQGGLTKNDLEATAKLSLSGNSLSGIPMAALTATRERPLFTATRSPPQRLAPRTEVVRAPVESKPQFSLIGAVSGEDEDIAVILDHNTKVQIRLKTGESHLGWVLQRVEGREAVLDNNQKTATLTIANQVKK